MSRRRRRRHRDDDLIVPVSSFADIAFLLIIFFLIAGKFAKEAEVKLELPRATALTEIETAPVIVSVDEEGRIYLEGAPVGDADTLERAITRIIELRGIEASQLRVQFKCDREIDQKIFMPAMRAISRSGAQMAALGERKQGQ